MPLGHELVALPDGSETQEGRGIGCRSEIGDCASYRVRGQSEPRPGASRARMRDRAVNSDRRKPGNRRSRAAVKLGCLCGSHSEN